MSDIEKLAKKIFDECAKDNEPVTMADALEMAEMELKDKKNRRYEQKMTDLSEKKDKKPKIVKVSDEKQMLFNQILGCVNTIYGENAQIVKENKLICVKIGEKEFKIDIIETRVKK